jgi:transcription-repair coupling factor (superfamily II helicase)
MAMHNKHNPNMTSSFETSIIQKINKKINPLFIEGTGSYYPVLYSLGLEGSSLKRNYKHIFVVNDDKEAQEIINYLKQNLLNYYYLPDFEVSPYSGLTPSTNMSALRIQFLNALQTETQGVFIATLSSLSQKTLPLNYLKENTYQFKIGQDFPEPIDEFLNLLGYKNVALVEDFGQYSLKGGILDLFSPAHNNPIRIELFGDTIESLRLFDVENQRSISEGLGQFTVLPAKETFVFQDNIQSIFSYLKKITENRNTNKDELELLNHSVRNHRDFIGQEFLISGFWPQLSLPKDFIKGPSLIWIRNKELLQNNWYGLIESYNLDYQNDEEIILRPDLSDLFSLTFDEFMPSDIQIHLDEVLLKELEDIERTLDETSDEHNNIISYPTSLLSEFLSQCDALRSDFNDFKVFLKTQILNWKTQGDKFVISTVQDFNWQRVTQVLKSIEISYVDINSLDEIHQNTDYDCYILRKEILQTIRLKKEELVLLKYKDLFGRSVKKQTNSKKQDYFNKIESIRFGELKTSDLVIHIQHGLGKFVGLKTLDVQGVPSEFIEIHYKGNDKLFLPVHRINQVKIYGGPSNDQLIDKLGGSTFEKAKIKVKNHLRDIANDLLKIYAERSLAQRPAYDINQQDLFSFENEFTFEETEDQLKAIELIHNDLQSDKPMDRLICGDVGFGKTEVSMRAAFHVLSSGKQVAVLAPTTVLAFQHFNSFKKRLAHWGFNIKALNRFVPNSEIKNTLKELKEGKVDLVVGTHRVLSQDVQFKDLGLLICDEEQKFGVRHKEKIRKLRSQVDTLTLSATPIPRTLNMSLLGLRDLSLITTAPTDRQPIRTFITKFNTEIIKKAVYSEVKRGGQVFFVHNRVQSIYGLHDQLKSLFFDLRIAVGHGQMEEKNLEKVIMSFVNKEVDILLSTTIIESGVDIGNANTMFIDNAHQFGLSQLYQLRGRVGRSKNKAYCYLIIPKGRQLDKDALERLKILQENTTLGSGIRIAHYDLELRGAGNLLGENQSGHVNIVGYDLYMELLQQAISEAQGKVVTKEIDPEINIPLPALIPSDYIQDIRLRLAYYKLLSNINEPEDLDRIDQDLTDQFGKPPIEVINLFTMMLVKKICKNKGIKELKSGPKTLSLTFDSQTQISVDRILKLTQLENKKYKLLPGDRLVIRMNELDWPKIYEEVNFL